MSVQDKSIPSADKVKVKGWYWYLLALGSAMVIGGIVGVIVL